MQTIRYPVKGRKLEETVTQQTLDMLITQLEDWQQGPGVFGSLHLHSCWGTASVLDKQYHGETTFTIARQMRVVRRLYAQHANPKWRVLENAMASHLLYLQDASGGFIHACAEFEPSFGTNGCPIHWFYPIIALCEYYQWEHADEDIKTLIPAAIERQWEWSLKHTWRNGNSYKHPLPHPGWCGVTNQDLVAALAVTMSAKLFDHPERIRDYVMPALDYLLSDAYYFPAIGLFERGDTSNFAERSTYYTVILDAIERLYALLGDERLPVVYDNVAAHLFDAVFTKEDGLTYIARGAITDPVDKTRVVGWDYEGTIAFDHYPELITQMQGYLNRHPSAEKQAVLESLKDTVAAYVFADGNIPLSVSTDNPLFYLASSSNDGRWLNMVMDLLGDWEDPKHVEIPAIHRTRANFTWKRRGRLWAIEADGVRRYGGFSRYAAGVTIGPEQQPVYGNFDSLDEAEILEIVD